MDIYQKAIQAIRSSPYICTTCGKTFDYPPAQSRINGKNVCRKCSAKESLDAAGIEEQDEILNMIR